MTGKNIRDSFKQVDLGIYDIYLIFSAIASCLIWPAVHLDRIVAYGELEFYSTFLLVLSYYSFTHVVGNIQNFAGTSYIPLFLCTQISALLGLSFSQQIPQGIYLILVPFSFSIYYFQRTKSESGGFLSKIMAMALVCTGTYYSLSEFYDYSLIQVENSFVFAVFALWSVGILYAVVDFNRRYQKSFIYSLFRRSKAFNSNTVNQTDADKYFFHDLINQTHGLTLFLKGKESTNEPVSPVESRLILKEIEIIQSMVHDHFRLKHKDLIGKNEYLSFYSVKDSVLSTIEHFLPARLVKKSFSYSGALEDSPVNQNLVDTYLHYPTFFRILTNIVKNISEVGSTTASFNFHSDNEFFKLSISNSLPRNASEKNEFVKRLTTEAAKSPNEDREKIVSIGLDSIQSLVDQKSGEFDFSIQDGHWLTEIKLPAINKDDIQSNTTKTNYIIKNAA